MSIWTGKTYEITETSGPGAIWLKYTDSMTMMFELEADDSIPDYFKTGTPRYRVKSKSNRMKNVWTHAWLHEVPPSGAGKHPALQGWMPVLIKGEARLDLVHIIYVQKAIVESDNEATDMIYITLAFGDAGDMVVFENGGGSGPPH
jgi:hypothetical protein